MKSWVRTDEDKRKERLSSLLRAVGLVALIGVVVVVSLVMSGGRPSPLHIPQSLILNVDGIPVQDLRYHVLQSQGFEGDEIHFISVDVGSIIEVWQQDGFVGDFVVYIVPLYRGIEDYMVLHNPSVLLENVRWDEYQSVLGGYKFTSQGWYLIYWDVGGDMGQLFVNIN
ncbi:MAG: hypothetical protein FWD97_07080 [Defluviitaleaceae bacterium]|nr:hypothetical protein [Defluviitaleaceae bacterium]